MRISDRTPDYSRRVGILTKRALDGKPVTDLHCLRLGLNPRSLAPLKRDPWPRSPKWQRRYAAEIQKRLMELAGKFARQLASAACAGQNAIVLRVRRRLPGLSCGIIPGPHIPSPEEAARDDAEEIFEKSKGKAYHDHMAFPATMTLLGCIRRLGLADYSVHIPAKINWDPIHKFDKSECCVPPT